MSHSEHTSETGNEQLGSTDSSNSNRFPFWLNEGSQTILCWLHIPQNDQISNTGVIICNPLGYEYSHTHRTVRHLSNHLSSKGYATIRFDYNGTGDSASDLFATERINTFLKNIDSVIDILKRQTGVEKICLIGLRLGGSLAASYCNHSSIDSLVLWSCYTKGRTYIRETKALEKLASHSNNSGKKFIDSGGFIVTAETEKELQQVNLLKQSYLIKDSVLIIERDDLPTSDKLLDILKEKNIPSEKYLMTGYLDMMAEPHQTKIPKTTLTKISSWLGDKESDAKLHLSQQQKNWFCQFPTANHEAIAETICLQQESRLMGVLSRPASNLQANKDKTLVLLANSGSVHRVGPNRVYVELAREASIAGFSVLRFDLSNLGDSVVGEPTNENHPYPFSSTQDIANTISYMKKHFGYKKFILAGLCSGAYSVFHAGLQLPKSANICEVIMINLLTIYRPIDSTERAIPGYQVEKDSQQYSQSVVSLGKWKKLFSGKVDLVNLTNFAVQKLSRTFSLKMRLLGELIGIHSGSRLSMDLKTYAERGIKINFFIASRDPGIRIIMSQAKKNIVKMANSDSHQLVEVPESDHTFSEHSCRKEFVRLFVNHLRTNYSKKTNN